jgi:hypothetical protein
MLNERLDNLARDRKIEHSLGVTCGAGLMHCAATTLSRAATRRRPRLPQPWKLCPVRKFDQKLGRAEQPERN